MPTSDAGDLATRQQGRQRRRRGAGLARLGLMAAIAVGALVALRLTPLGDLLSEDKVESLVGALGSAAMPGFVLLYAVLVAVWVPGTIMTAAGAAIFPTAVAVPLNYAGALLGAVLGFSIARVLGGDALDLAFDGRSSFYARYRRVIEERGFESILYLRLIPTPYNALSWLAGLSPMSLLRFTLATAIGILPGSFAITYLMGTLVAAFREEDWAAFLSLRTFSALALFAGAAAVPTLVRLARVRLGWFGGVPDAIVDRDDKHGGDG